MHDLVIAAAMDKAMTINSARCSRCSVYRNSAVSVRAEVVSFAYKVAMVTGNSAVP